MPSKKKAQVNTVIKDSASLLSDLSNLAKQAVPQYFAQNGRALTIYNIILSVVAVVEQYSSEVGTLSTDDKINFCFQLLPIVINLLQTTGAITADQAATFNSYAADAALVKGFIQVAGDIVENPEIVSLETRLKAKVSSCCFPKKSK